MARRSLCLTKGYNAVTPMMSAVVVVLIVVSSVASIFVWGLPYIDRMESKASQESVYSQLATVKEGVMDMIYAESGSARKYNLDIPDGQVSIDENGDRFVVAYSLDPNFDFNVTGLGDADDTSFQVTVEPIGGFSPPTLTRAEVYCFRDPELRIPCSQDKSFIDCAGNRGLFLRFDLTQVYGSLDEKINDIDDIVSACIRLYPVTPSKDATWQDIMMYPDQTLGKSSFCRLPPMYSCSPDIIVGQDYVDIDISDYFVKKYDLEEPEIALLVSKNLVQLNLPVVWHQNPMLEIGLPTDYVQVFGRGSSSDLNPELIVNYVELTDSAESAVDKCIETEISERDDVSSPDTSEDNSSYYVVNKDFSVPAESIRKGCFRVDNTTYELHYDITDMHVYFNERSSDTEPLYCVTQRNSCFCSRPGNLFFSSNTTDSPGNPVIYRKEVEGELSDYTLYYADQFGMGIDLYYKTFTTGVKEYLKITNADSLTGIVGAQGYLLFEHKISAYSDELNMPLGVVHDGVCIREFGSYTTENFTTALPVYFVDDAGVVVFSLPSTIYAWDSSSSERSKIQLSREVRLKSSGDITVYIRTPWEWLKDPSRVYPVFIDDTYYTSNSNPASGADPPIRGNVVARRYAQTDFPPLPPGTVDAFEYGNGAYELLAENDDVMNEWPNGAGGYVNLWYTTSILEQPEDIAYIKITWVGHNDGVDWNTTGTGNDLFLYVWDHNNSMWGLQTSAPATANKDTLNFVLSNDVTSGNYVNLSEYVSAYRPLQVVFVSQGDSCFTANTSVAMADGTYKNIDTVRKGDKVLSFDEDAETVSVSIVKDTFEHISYDLLCVNNRLYVTPEHPLWVNGKWQNAEQIHTGDKLLRVDGFLEEVTSLASILSETTTYNLHVEPFHTFFTEDILAHNKEPPKYIHEDYFEVFVKSDSVPPDIEIEEGPSDNELVRSDTVGFSWSAEERKDSSSTVSDTIDLGGSSAPPAENIEYSYDLDLDGTYNAPASGWTSQTQRTFTDLADGEYTFMINARDQAGNTGADSRSFTIINGLTDRETWIPEVSSADPTTYWINLTNADLDFSGSTRVDLYASGLPLTDPVGRILIFDLGSVTYTLQSTIGNYNTILENGGILFSNPDEIASFRKKPVLSSDSSLLSLRVVQTKYNTQLNSAATGQTQFVASLEDNYVRELLTNVNHVKLQFWGDYAEKWLQYVNTTLGFIEADSVPHTFMHPNLGVPVDLMLTQSSYYAGLRLYNQ